MESIRRLFGWSRPLPQRVETDDIYPVHMLDGTKTLRGIIVSWTARFDDVLDAEKLHESLAKLLEIGDWRKMGGRLRLKDNGELEIHAPNPFTTERPAVAYSHAVHDMSITEHPLGKTLPQSTSTPSIHTGPDTFREFSAAPNAPSTFEDFIYTDTPMLSLHVTSFTDATLVSLLFPHTLMDIMGQRALLSAWSLVLNGREGDVPPMLGAREDTICSLADSPSAESTEPNEEWILGKKQLKGTGMIMFGARYAWDMLTTPSMATRTVCLPQKTIYGMRRQAQDDLDSEGRGKPFLSDGDILTAWASRCIALSLPVPRPMTILHAINVRFRLPSLQAETSTSSSGGVHTQNMAIAAFTFLPPITSTTPLGTLALSNRTHLTDQATESQVLKFLQALKSQCQPGTGTDPAIVCGESNALLVPFTNWDRADILGCVDFRGALKPDSGFEFGSGEGQGQGQEQKERLRLNPPGTPVYHHSHAMKLDPTMRNVVVVLGKDYSGNFWITGMLQPAAWDVMQREMGGLV